MIKFFVRTTGDRTLDNSIKRELGEDFTLLVDTKHKNIESFIEQLKVMNNYDSVLLEDDVVLCRDFKKHIEEVIASYPDKIINFFSAPTEYLKSGIVNSNFSFQQCRYFPKGSSAIFIEELPKFTHNKKVCPCLNVIAVKHSIKIMHYRPCLVQHLDFDSLVGNATGWRITPYFKDYLDELGISYDDAEKEENTQKLINLMKNKFKEVDK